MAVKNYCTICRAEIAEVCERCGSPFVMTVMGGWRDELIGELAEEFKYHSVRTIGGVLAEVLSRKIPEVQGEVVVIPLPTIMKHVRQRGLDHTAVVARKLARRRGWEYEKVLVRRGQKVQVGATAKERTEQARLAYGIRDGAQVRPGVTYLLYDDIWTTGASMLAAAKILRKAGAQKIIMVVAAVSRTLEEIEKGY